MTNRFLLAELHRVGPDLAAAPPYGYRNPPRCSDQFIKGETSMHAIPLAALAVIAAVAGASAADIEVNSAIDSVMVYPDGATVTRIIRIEVPAGDTNLIARDFPPGLDPESLRVEGETNSRVVIGSIDARPPKAIPPVNAPELEKKIEALRDQRAAIEDDIAAQTARKRFADRFASSTPLGLGDKGDARPLSCGPVPDETPRADAKTRKLKSQHRDPAREIARREAHSRPNPPRKLEVRTAPAAEAATAGTLRVSYTVRGARWVPIYDARLDTGSRDRQPSLELVRRAEIGQQTGEGRGDGALSVPTRLTATGGAGP